VLHSFDGFKKRASARDGRRQQMQCGSHSIRGRQCRTATAFIFNSFYPELLPEPHRCGACQFVTAPQQSQLRCKNKKNTIGCRGLRRLACSQGDAARGKYASQKNCF